MKILFKSRVRQHQRSGPKGQVETVTEHQRKDRPKLKLYETFDRHGKKIKVSVPPRDEDGPEGIKFAPAYDDDGDPVNETVKRADVVKQLVDDDMAEMEDDPSDLRKILENGHKGYKNMTDKELADFYEEQYGEAITIKAGKA